MQSDQAFNRLRAALICLALLAIPHASQAIEFQGDKLGGDLLEFVRRHDRPAAKEAGARAPHFWAADKTGLVTASVNVKFEGIPETVGGVPADIWYYFVCANIEDWTLLQFLPRHRPANWEMKFGKSAARTRLAWVSASIASRDYPRLVAALTSKFGPPTATDTVVKQNGFGAQFSSSHSIWQIDEFVIRAEEVGGTVGKGSLTYSMPELVLLLERFNLDSAVESLVFHGKC
jgi:hypothetical protein